MSGSESSIWRRAIGDETGKGDGFDHGAPWVPGGSVLVNDSCGWEPSKHSEQVWSINDLCKEDACGM